MGIDSVATFPIDTQVYTAGEVAAAAGLDEAAVRAATSAEPFIAHADAVDVALRLRRAARLDAVLNPVAPPDPFARLAAPAGARIERLPLALSGTMHLLLVSALVLLGSFQVAPSAHVATARSSTDDLRLVFLDTPGPGGGGGGGGRRQPLAPSRAARTGRHPMSSPVPPAAPPPPTQAAPPPLDGETFPVVNAPVVAAPADPVDRTGVLAAEATAPESAGPGSVDGAGTGAGRGLGRGTGSGIGEGSGGGTGGGPYRPGAGITPPRVLHEVKATYTDEARRAGITGEVLLEVVVRHTGDVGSIRLLRGLGAGLDQRAIDAVRQWSFAPAARHGTPVDVLVEVSVEFSLR